MKTPQDQKMYVRQAYGFFYLRPEHEADALEAAHAVLQGHHLAYSDYLGKMAADAAASAASLEALHFEVTRDGEGRIVNLLRRDGPAMIPILDHQVLEAMAPYVDGAELVFTNAFGDGWEWKAGDGRLLHQAGRVTVVHAKVEGAV
jgi:hypothetical protein